MGSLIIWTFALGFGVIFLVQRLRRKRKAGEGDDITLGGAWVLLIIVSLFSYAYAIRYFLGDDFYERHPIYLLVIMIIGIFLIFKMASISVYGKETNDEQ